MSKVSKESEFYQFMVKRGPSSKKGRKNYISWLRYVGVKCGYNIDESLSRGRVDEFIIWLKATKTSRDEYNSDSSVSDIKSSLNKYLSFIDACLENSSICVDIKSITNSDITTTQKMEIDVRVGQGKYRRDLIELWSKCAVTSYSNIDFLIASHIKPWRSSEKAERVDPYNGLLLTPNIDKMFDGGYISFEEDGNIIISSLLTEDDLVYMNISKQMQLYKVFDQNIPYLSYHQKSVFIK